MGVYSPKSCMLHYFAGKLSAAPLRATDGERRLGFMTGSLTELRVSVFGGMQIFWTVKVQQCTFLSLIFLVCGLLDSDH